MENATKALLIAAAVLVVILIIALGMRIFNSTGDATAQVETTGASTALQTFNAQFSSYIGSNRSAATIRTLEILVNQSNTANPGHQVNYTAPTGGVTDGKVYTVTATYGSATLTDGTAGYITNITVN